MNYNLNYEPLLLICGSRSTENALLEQLRGFLPKEVPIISFSIKTKTSLRAIISPCFPVRRFMMIS